jgi:hypothetical protein
MKNRNLNYLFKFLILCLPFLQAYALLSSQNFSDPRNGERVLRLKHERESNAFKEDLQGKSFRRFFFPGLKAAQLSYIWLETLQGLHFNSSFERDYSWLFSKLHTFAIYSNSQEYRRILSITPVLFVIGKDPIGSTILMNELIHRAPQFFTPWYWGGYHAIENLKDRQLAAEMFYQTSKRPGAPIFAASLAEKLGHRELSALSETQKEEFQSQLDPNIPKRTIK